MTNREGYLMSSRKVRLNSCKVRLRFPSYYLFQVAVDTSYPERETSFGEEL